MTTKATSSSSSSSSWWWGTTSEEVNAATTTPTASSAAAATALNISRRSSGFVTGGGSRDIEEAAATTSHETVKKDPLQRRPSLKPHEMTQSPPVEKPPASRGLQTGHLPLTINKQQGAQAQHVPEPKLIHPILNKISITTRFAFNGMLSNVLFMMAYNWSIQNVPEVAPPTMYSIVYLVFIPIGHAMVSLFVFGWPEHYCPSLMSNFPIGLTAIGIGGGLTAWLDSIEFNEMVADYVRSNFTFSNMPVAGQGEGEFYSSIVVLVVTSLWTYVLSIYVNAPPEKSEKKEL